ncbi:hypothetical protein chiPu_0032495, partial [Chiloscyllium punctatum]|nr:hypothetical protein [Chiloscyllium punctatum]
MVKGAGLAAGAGLGKGWSLARGGAGPRHGPGGRACRDMSKGRRQCHWKRLHPGGLSPNYTNGYSTTAAGTVWTPSAG